MTQSGKMPVFRSLLRTFLNAAGRSQKMSQPERSNRIDTSIGPIYLTEAEAKLLGLGEAGYVNRRAWQDLCDSLANRNQAVPPEWKNISENATFASHVRRDGLPESFTAAAQQMHKEVEAANVITFDASGRTIHLTDEELTLLRRLQDGEYDWEAGQALYSSLSARDVAFPMEWERLVLRATLRSLPERTDLLERLASVEEQLDVNSSDIQHAVEFERLKWRARNINLVTSEGGMASEADRSTAFGRAVAVLASGDFAKQSTKTRCEIIKGIHDTFMSLPDRDLYLIADVGLHAFEHMLKTSEPTFAEAATIHDCLHAMFFSGVSDIRDLRRFDRITPLFEAWLKEHNKGTAIELPPLGQTLSIAYFLHVGHFNRGNAVSPLIASLAEMHSKRADRRVVLYATQHLSPGFVEAMEQRGVTVRAFPQGMQYDRLEEIEATLRQDAIDVVVTEQNRAIAAALFVRRVAQCQIWLDTGFPFWNLQSLDWTLSPPLQGQADLPPKTSGMAWRQRLDTLKQNTDQQDVDRVRAGFPENAFVLGIFVRLIKLDQSYLEFIGRLLMSSRRFHLVIAGPGDPVLVKALMQRQELAGRITFVEGMVNLNIYGRAIDAMCDTFPFIGGNACREVAVHGTPTISKLGTPWDGVLKSDRNPDLLAKNEEEYITLANRLANDPLFLERQRAIALEKAEEYCYPEQMIEDVEAAIAGAIASNYRV